MNLRILEFLAVALAFITTASMGNTEETAANKEPLMKFKVRTTAYTHTESDHVEYGNKSALGTVLRYTPEYHSAAADWSFLPMSRGTYPHCLAMLRRLTQDPWYQKFLK